MVCHHTKTTDFIQGRVVQLNVTARKTGEFPKQKQNKQTNKQKKKKEKRKKGESEKCMDKAQS